MFANNYHMDGPRNQTHYPGLTSTILHQLSNRTTRIQGMMQINTHSLSFKNIIKSKTVTLKLTYFILDVDRLIRADFKFLLKN
jgi:hypothetical protein